MSLKSLLMLGALLAAATPASAQPPGKITVGLEVRTEGRATRDETAAHVEADVKVALEAIQDVAVVPRLQAGRVIWIIVGAGPTAGNSASVVATERYDRGTLLQLGVRDEGMAERMMLQRIVINHEIFTGKNLQELSTRIVAWVTDNVLVNVRAAEKR